MLPLSLSEAHSLFVLSPRLNNIAAFCLYSLSVSRRCLGSVM